MIDLPELAFSDYQKVDEVAPPLLPGVYIYANECGEVVYVGKSKCLRERHAQHEWAKDVPGAVLYSYAVLRDMVDVDIYETYYINKYLPPLNKAKRFSEENEQLEDFTARLIAQHLGISVRRAWQLHFNGK